jgi:hypothetical protein
MQSVPKRGQKNAVAPESNKRRLKRLLHQMMRKELILPSTMRRITLRSRVPDL